MSVAIKDYKLQKFILDSLAFVPPKFGSESDQQVRANEEYMNWEQQYQI